VLIGLTALAGEVIPSLNVEAALQSAASGYVHSLFPAQALPSPSGALNLPLSALTGLFIALGFLAAASFYLARRVPPSRLVGQTGFTHSLHVFLEKRWYINALYYKVFVNAPLAASRWLSDTFDSRGLFRINSIGSAVGVLLSSAGNWIDTKIVDGAANGISSSGQALSRAVRRIQTGIVEQYAQIFAIGVIVMLVLLLLAVGVRLP
jgi:NADH:ubiquinone oxidoreductase subunit 5 (subunit L)/multisubunit Na+/H+ antiporter MnhA subunit